MTLPKSDSAPHLEALLSHSAWVKHLARAIATTRDLADEVEQEAWRLALERPPRHTRNLKAWWSSVVRNSVIQKRRSEARYQKRVDRLEPPATSRADGDPSVLSESMEDFELLARYVNELPPQLGEAIFLRFFQDKSVPQIAVQLDVPQTTVKSRLRRGLEQLRERFQSVHGEDWRARCLALAAPSTPTLSLTTITALLFMSTKTKLIAAGILGISLVGYSLWSPEAEPIQEVENLPIEAELAEVETQQEPAVQNVRTEELPEKAPNYLTHRQRNPEIPLPDDAIRDAWFQLTVLDHEGNPWPDLPLDLGGSPRHIFQHRYATTNHAGQILIPCISGDFSMMVHSSKRDGGNDLSYSNSFSLEPHETAKVLIQHPGWNQIHGSVVDFEGNPLEGISIGYGGNDGKEPNEFQINSSAKSSADGSFSIRAINGRYGISASTEHSLAISTHGKIQAGQVADPIRIQFPETRFVELKILNADGSAMESAKVEFAWHDVPRNSAPNSHTYDHRRLGETDLDGKKLVEAPLHMDWPLDVYYKNISGLFISIPPEVTEFEYRLTSGSSLFGTIVDHMNNPISGAKVMAWAPELHPVFRAGSAYQSLTDLEDWLFTTTDSSGKFQLDRLPESQDGHLFVAAKGNAYIGLSKLPIPCVEDGIEIKMYPEKTLSGTLLDREEHPVISRSIQLNGNPCFGLTTDWQNLPYFADAYRIRTDAQGKFIFRGLSESQSWQIDVSKIGDHEPAALVTAQSGAQDLVIHLGDGLLDLVNVEVSVVDALTGVLVSDLRVLLWHPKTIDGKFAGASADTARILPKLPQAVFSGHEIADHIVQVDAPGYSSVRTLITAEAGLHKVKIELQQASKVQFQFQNEAGEMMPKLGIRVRFLNGEISTNEMGMIAALNGNGVNAFDAWTNDDGEVELNIPLLGGHFEIEAPDSDTPIQIPFGPELATAEGVQTVVVGG